MRAIFIVLVACSTHSQSPPPPRAAVVADARADASPPPDPRRWFAGDLHMHVAPPDDADVLLPEAEIARRAVAAKMDFVVLTPHVWQWPNRSFAAAWTTLAATARAESEITMIPGVEWTTRTGHFTVTGVDVTALGDDFLAAAHAAGAFVSVNHPFAVPTNIGAIPASHYDMSYRVWTDRARGFTDIDGVEVWNFPLGVANVISRPGGRTGEANAWTEANRVVHAEHRKLTAVGGTDNHRENVMPTTWVLATDRSERAILDGLRTGATCVGSPAGGSLRARGDGDPAWHRIGESVSAPHVITLVWDGIARLFIDDVDQGEHAGGFEHATGGALHTYRIVIGSSRCGFVYANLG
jgi:predicted metal-dependent phosphoesterase TrpH